MEVNVGYQPIKNVDTSKPPGGELGLKSPSLSFKVDVQSMDVFKNMLQVVKYLFQQSDEQAQIVSLRMMEGSGLIELMDNAK